MSSFDAADRGFGLGLEFLLGGNGVCELNRFAVSLEGPNAALYVGDDLAVDGGRWQRSYFNSFSATIGGGTSQIQQNIIGERVLGLPKS